MLYFYKLLDGVMYEELLTKLIFFVLEVLIYFKVFFLMVEDFRGVLLIFIIIVDFDVLRDEGFFYVERLQSVKIKVKYKNYKFFYGFVILVIEGGLVMIDEGDEVFVDIVEYIKDMISSQFYEGKIMFCMYIIYFVYICNYQILLFQIVGNQVIIGFIKGWVLEIN